MKTSSPDTQRWDPRPFVFFFFMALVSLWPLPLHISNGLPLFDNPAVYPGDGDPFMFCWNFWWVRDWVTGAHSLYDCRMLHHPWGISLTHHTLSVANGLLAAPLTVLRGVAAAYNILLLFHALFTGLGVYYLLRVWGADRSASFFAGQMMLFWPCRTMHAAAHINLAGTAWIPWAILWQTQLVSRSGRRQLPAAILSVFAMVMCGLTSWYLLIILLLTAWVPLLAASGGRRRTVFLLGLTWAATALILLPFVLPMLANPAGIQPRPMEELRQYSAVPASFAVPSPLHPFWEPLTRNYYQSLPGNPVESTVYLGIFGFLTLFTGVILGDRRTRWCLAGAAGLLILALGPDLQIGALRIPLPGSLLHAVPGLNFARTPSRFTIGAGFLISLAAGWLISRQHWFRKPVIAFLAGLLLIMDVLPAPVPLAELPRTSWIDALPPGTNSRAVLDIPCDWRIRQYQYLQIFHQRPIAAGFVSRIPEAVHYRTAELPLFRQLADRESALSVLRSCDPVVFGDLLVLLNADTVILHRRYLPDRDPVIPQFLADRLGAVNVLELEQSVILQFPELPRTTATKSPRWYYSGWRPAESWPGIPEDVRWSMGTESSLALFVSPSADQVILECDLMPAPQRDGNPQSLTLSLNGRAVHSMELDSRWNRYSLTIPGPFNSGMNRLTLLFRSATRPMDLDPASTDRRSLGAAIRNITLKGFVTD